jgi:hypothetical protein
VRRIAALLAASLLAGYAGAAAAQADRPSATGAPSPELVRQKQALAQRLLADAPALARIAASGNAEAAQQLERARARHGSASGALQAGDYTAANALLNEAIAAIGRARQLAPDPAGRADEERGRYDQLLAGIDSLRESYREHLSHLGREAGNDAAWATVSQLVERARALAAGQRVGEANRVLLRAESAQLDAFGAVLAGRTLDYTPHFGEPADEFRFELERHRSYVELVPLAVAELRPGADASKLVARYVDRGEQLRRTAQQRAAASDYATALTSIRAGTAYLQRALLAAGLAVPQEQED